MTLLNVLQLALLTIAGVLFSLGLLIALRRVTRNRSVRNREARENQLRPLLMRCLAEEVPDTSILDGVADDNSKYLESLIWNMLTKVKGSSREALVDWLDSHGLVEAERLGTYSHDAVRRACAAERLGNAGRPDTARAIIRLLNDRHADVRIVAARALGKMGNAAAVAPLLEALDSKRNVPLSIVAMALLHIGPEVVDPLIEQLGSESENVRSVSCEILGMHGALTATRWITLIVLHDPSDDVRIKGANALGRIGAPSGVDVLVRSASPENPQRVRSAALSALGLIGGSDALGALQVGLNDVDDHLSAAAAEALSRLGEPGLEVLAAAASVEGPGQKRARDWFARTDLEIRTRRRRMSAVAS